MCALRPALTLEEAYRNLDPIRPLREEWFEAFYVPRPEDGGIEKLLDELNLDDSENDKTLFSGQQGAGESTELYRLYRELQSTHIPILLNVEETLNLGDVHYTDLLVMLGLRAYQEAHACGIRADEQHARDLLFWYRERILEQDEALPLQSETSAEVNLGVLRFGSRLSQESPRRERIRAVVEPNLSDLLERLNRLLLELRRRSGKRILMIVDGLDKIYNLRRAADLFLHGGNALMAPACRIIYTVPYPLFYSNDFQLVRSTFHRVFLLPNIKIRHRDGAPWETGREMLRQVLRRRVAETLLDPEAMEALVEASGGLLRELIRLARLSVILARRRRDARILPGDVAGAMREAQNTFRRILKLEDYRHLRKVQERKSLDDLPEEVADRLLHNLSILEYDGETWWDVHPAVRELLEENEGGK